MKTSPTYFCIKTGILIALVLMFPLVWMIPAAFFITFVYQYIIAFFLGVKVMPTMDVACFYGHEKANVNFMTCSLTDRFDIPNMKQNFLN